MSIFSKITDAFLRLVGLKKDKAPPPHAHYYNVGNGYWPRREVIVWAADDDYAAVRDACSVWNEAFRLGGINMYLHMATDGYAGVAQILVKRDAASSHVKSGQTGATSPEGEAPGTPWILGRVTTWIKTGVKGSELAALLVHELGHAIGIFAHSNDERDVMHPKARRLELSAADHKTLALTYQRRQRDQREPA